MNNPFRKNTLSHHDWEILTDLKWHCTKCELRAGQAKTWQTWRQEKGIQVGKNKNGQWKDTRLCGNCGYKTVHRKLESLDILKATKSRSGVSQSLARKVKKLFHNEDALLLRKFASNLLEIDHKFPQIRWGSDEDENSANMSDNEIRKKFILLTRSNNLLKSRHCEKCVKTGVRGNFPGIYFWYKGDKNWRGDTHNENGCVGCFWYNPHQWRQALNAIVNK